MRRRSWQAAAALVGGIVGLTFAGLGGGSASAATITVSNTNDSGAGSLREAIAAAGSGDTIVVPPSASHYALTSAELAIGKSLTIAGGGTRGHGIRRDEDPAPRA